MKYILLGLVLASCSGKAPQQTNFVPPAVPVTTAEVAIRDVPLYFEEMGIVTPYQTAEVKPQVNGLITSVHFQEGQWVEQGELLYIIEEAPYSIKVQEAEAQLAQNMANLQNAKKKLDRYKSLSKQDLIAQVEWDELETRITLSEAMVKGDEARLAAAKLDLARCRIVASISGRTSKTSLQAGNMVASHTTLVTLSQEKSLFVDFSITERELYQLPSSKISFEVFAAGEEECLASGEVTFIDHTIDPESGMIAASGLLTHMHKPLFTGQIVRLHVFFGNKLQAKLVPLRAIKTNQSGAYLFSVKEDSTVELRNVKLGP